MFVDGENSTPETPAAAAETSAAPAAEPVVPEVSTTPAPAVDPATLLPAHHHDVAEIDYLEDRVIAIAERLIGGDKFMVELEAAVARELDARVDNLKADILAHLTPMIAAVVGNKTAAPTAAAPAIAPADLKVKDPVKVWQDAERKTFLEGNIVAIHDGAHAFDVKLPDGSVSKVGADGLEYDDRR